MRNKDLFWQRHQTLIRLIELQLNSDDEDYETYRHSILGVIKTLQQEVFCKTDLEAVALDLFG